MRTLRIELKGTTPLLMHSCRGVNPLDPLSLKMKSFTSKRGKTEEDTKAISDLEWELGLYWDDTIGLYIPAENIEKTIQEGATARKKGKHIVKGFRCLDLRPPLDIGEKLTLEQMREDYRFRDVRSMTVQRARIMRTRPRFNRWAVGFDAAYDEDILDVETIAAAIEYAGKYVGLCDSRPKYGQFVPTRIEELN